MKFQPLNFIILYGCLGLSQALFAATPSVNHDTSPSSADELSQALIAEFAIQRHQFDNALDYYLSQARLKRQTIFAERATELALHEKRYLDMLEASLIWQEVDNANTSADFYTSLAFAYNQQAEAALDNMLKVLNRNGDTDFTRLINIQNNFSNTHYLHTLEKAHLNYPNNYDISIAVALMYQNSGNNEKMLAYTDAALPFALTNLAAMAIIIQNYDDAKAYKKAIYAYQQAIDANDNNTELRQALAKYARDIDPVVAKEQLETLLKDDPNNSFALVNLGFLYLQANTLDDAKPYFQQLINTQQHASTAHYFLGEIYRLQHQYEPALDEFNQVTENGDKQRALEKIIAIYIDQQQFSEAKKLLDSSIADTKDTAHKEQLLLLNALLIEKKGEKEQAFTYLTTALDNFPQSFDLRYSRAMLADDLNNLPVVESDLRFILETNPDNALTLNALGYVLASKTSRLQEAYDLLRRAEKAAPNDPAIMDSLGWVMYRMGNNQESIKYLQNAIQKMPDAEVAAHLGEVLWTSGRKDDAVAVFKKALKHSPEDNLLNDTIKRLNIGL